MVAAVVGRVGVRLHGGRGGSVLDGCPGASGADGARDRHRRVELLEGRLVDERELAGDAPGRRWRTGPEPLVATSGTRPAGSVSVTGTPNAVEGPAFWTSIVYSNRSPATSDDRRALGDGSRRRRGRLDGHGDLAAVVGEAGLARGRARRRHVGVGARRHARAREVGDDDVDRRCPERGRRRSHSTSTPETWQVPSVTSSMHGVERQRVGQADAACRGRPGVGDRVTVNVGRPAPAGAEGVSVVFTTVRSATFAAVLRRRWRRCSTPSGPATSRSRWPR